MSQTKNVLQSSKTIWSVATAPIVWPLAVLVGIYQELKDFLFICQLERLSVRFAARSKTDPVRGAVRFKYALDRLLRGKLLRRRAWLAALSCRADARYSIWPDALIAAIAGSVETDRYPDHPVQQIDPTLVIGASWKMHPCLDPESALDVLRALNESANSERNRCVVHRYFFGGMTLHLAIEGKNRVRWHQIYGGTLTCAVIERTIALPLSLAYDIMGNLYLRNRAGEFQLVCFPAIVGPLVKVLPAGYRRLPLPRIGYVDRLRAYDVLLADACRN